MRKSKKIAVVTATSVALVGGGIAYAYWTTSGSGSGTGSTTAGVVNQLSFTQDSLAAMYPGDSSQPLSVTVKNTSTESAYVSTVKAYVTTDKNSLCDGSNFLLNGNPAPSTAANAVALSWTAADLASNGAAAATGTIQFNNKGTVQDDCKNAAVTVHYLAS